MIFVYSCAYYHKKEHIVTEHTFQDFEKACQIVAEVWGFEPGNVYTIVDEGEK